VAISSVALVLALILVALALAVLMVEARAYNMVMPEVR
jgi:hypothetical protein